MFRLVNGNSKKATVDMARCGDWCFICDNLEDNDQYSGSVVKTKI